MLPWLAWIARSETSKPLAQHIESARNRSNSNKVAARGNRISRGAVRLWRCRTTRCPDSSWLIPSHRESIRHRSKTSNFLNSRCPCRDVHQNHQDFDRRKRRSSSFVVSTAMLHSRHALSFMTFWGNSGAPKPSSVDSETDIRVAAPRPTRSSRSTPEWRCRTRIGFLSLWSMATCRTCPRGRRRSPSRRGRPSEQSPRDSDGRHPS